jgi:hypothetical protein
VVKTVPHEWLALRIFQVVVFVFRSHQLGDLFQNVRNLCGMLFVHLAKVRTVRNDPNLEDASRVLTPQTGRRWKAGSVNDSL